MVPDILPQNQEADMPEKAPSDRTVIERLY
jgi:hypothetical protein